MRAVGSVCQRSARGSATQLRRRAARRTRGVSAADKAKARRREERWGRYEFFLL
jgi:hypothetical protein